MLSCAVLAGRKLHTDTIRAIHTLAGRIYTGSIDGKLKASHVSHTPCAPRGESFSIEELQVLQEGPAVTALCPLPHGFISCTESGLFLSYSEDGGVEQIRFKALARVSAVCYHERSKTLFAGDWDGNFYSLSLDGQDPWIQTFPQFTVAEPSDAPVAGVPKAVQNAVLSLCCNDGMLLCGLADGSIRVYSLAGKCPTVHINFPATIIRKHRRPVRALECLSQAGAGPFLSAGNDGALIYHWPTGAGPAGATLGFESATLSEAFLSDQYLLCSATFALGSARYVAVAGCDCAVYIFRVDGCMCGDPDKVGLVGTLPVISDVYCLGTVDICDASAPSAPGASNCVQEENHADSRSPVEADSVIMGAGLESGELLVFQVSSVEYSELPDSIRMSHERYLSDCAFGSRVVTPSRVTGKHESYITAASVHCGSFAQLSSTSPVSPGFRGHLVACVLQPGELPIDFTAESPAPSLPSPSAAGRAFAVLSSNSKWYALGCLEITDQQQKHVDEAGRSWDVELPVVNDRNQRTYKLFFDYGEDPYDVASRFLMNTDIIDTDGYNTTDYKAEIVRFVESSMPATTILPEYQVDTMPAMYEAFSHTLGRVLGSATWDPREEFALPMFGAASNGVETGPQDTTSTGFYPKMVSYNLVRKCVTVLSDRVNAITGYSGGEDATSSANSSSLEPDQAKKLRDAMFELECWFQGIREGSIESPQISSNFLLELMNMGWDGPDKTVGALLCILCFLLQDGRHSEVYDAIDTYFDAEKLSKFEHLVVHSTEKACTTFLIRLLAWLSYDARQGNFKDLINKLSSLYPQKLLSISTDDDLAALCFGFIRESREGKEKDPANEEARDAVLSLLASDDDLLERFPRTFEALNGQ